MLLQESRVNQQIANKSKAIATSAKRDSSAMFGISVLTMLFLPATFISVRHQPPILAIVCQKFRNLTTAGQDSVFYAPV